MPSGCASASGRLGANGAEVVPIADAAPSRVFPEMHLRLARRCGRDRSAEEATVELDCAAGGLQVEVEKRHAPRGQRAVGGDADFVLGALAADQHVVERDSARLGGFVAALQVDRFRRRRDHHRITHRIPARVEEEEIEPDAVADQHAPVGGLTVSRVADAGRVADRREAIDAIPALAVSTDAVVAAVDRADVLEHDVAAVRQIARGS